MMKTKAKLTARIVCMLLVVFCIVSLAACDLIGGKECAHEWSAWSTANDATCTEAGTAERTCNKCGATDASAIPATGHDWNEATCSAPKTCKNCSLTEGDVGTHAYTVETVKDAALKSAATCESAAIYYKSCACGEVSSSDADTFTYGEALAHSFTESTVKDEALKSAATCTSPAIYYKSCVCGAVSTSDGDTFTSGEALPHSYTEKAVKDEAIKTAATCENAATYYKSCICGAVSTSDTDIFTSGSALGHAFTAETVKESAIKTVATCTAPATYYKSCACGAISTSDDDTFTNGVPLAHTYNVETVKDEALKSAATCTSAATYYKSCVCGAISTSNAETFTSGTPSDHIHDQEIVSLDTLKATASCTSAATYYKSCACGNVSTDAAETFTSGSALPHDHKLVSSTEATCTAPASVTYACDCGDEYTETVGDAKSHDISGVEPTKRLVEGCKYVYVYVCKAAGCGADVEGEFVYNHTYIASITSPATCSEDGVKTLTCACGDSKTEAIAKDSTGHNWVKGEVTDGVRVDECSHCHTEKTVTVYEGNSTDSTNANEFKDTEIELNDANISLDDGVINAIGDKSVTVSADKLEGDDRTDLGLTDEQLAQVGDNPIYNFTISDGEGNISQFGEDNWVTITLPYTLAEGEDVDSIAVWFINDDGELESFRATYNNGYVTFKTNHFSYYTVTKLTPKERCALYGHNYVSQHVDGDCNKDEYDLYVCVRCHDKYIDYETYIAADGHDYESETVEATCTENGYVKYVCSDCGHNYTIKIKAIGHVWNVAEEKDSTCTENGYTRYECANCDGEYTTTYAKVNHEYTSIRYDATCEEAGYTLYQCNNCTQSYEGNYVAALGHDYESAGWTWATDYSSANVLFVCSHDPAHTVTVWASITVTVKNGTCSSFTRTTYHATLSFEGVIYENTEFTEVGNPDHVFSTEWSYNDTEHWHECICGEKADVTSHAYANTVVTKQPTCTLEGSSTSTCECGNTLTEVIPATGEHVYVDGFCTGCGIEFVDTYYLNLVNSWKTMNGFAIKFNDFTFELSEENSLSKELELEGRIKQIDVAEMMLYIEDGEICGAATGSIVIFNGPIPMTDVVLSMDATIDNGYVYIVLTGDVDGDERTATESLKIKADVETVLITLFEENIYVDESASESLPVLYDFLTENIVPMVSTLIELNAEGINSVLEDVFNMIFTFEKQADGSYVATLDYEKLYALNENLATKPVSEVVDIYFGEGTFEYLVTIVKNILNLKVSDIPNRIDKLGLDSAAIIDLLNEFSKMNGAPEDYDISVMLGDEAYGSYTLGMLMFETENSEEYVAFIDSIADMLREATAYQLIIPEYVTELKETIDYVIGIFNEGVTVFFTTDRNGALTSVTVDTDNFSFYSGDMYVTFDGGFEIVVNGKIDVTWSDIVDEIENAIVLPEDMPEDKIFSDLTNGYYYWYFYFNDNYYEVNSSLHLMVTETFYSKYSAITFSPDCGDWIGFNAYYPLREYNFSIAAIAVDGEPVIFIRDYTSNKIAKIVMTEDGYKAIYEDGTEIDLTIGNFESYVTEADFYTALCFEIFKDDSTKPDYFRGGFYYYYNPVTGEFSDDSQHDYVTEIVIDGEFCSTSGREHYITCTKCDYYSYYTYYHCNHQYVVIDLSEYTDCGGVIDAYLCDYCGHIEYINNTRFGCKWDSGVATPVFDDNGNEIGLTTTYTCMECGFVRVEALSTVVHNSCESTICYLFELYRDGECVLKRSAEYKQDSHNWDVTYELLGESCEDGYIVHEACTKCGQNYSWETAGHRYTVSKIDLQEYTDCGGYIYVEHCLICEQVFYYQSDLYCDMEHADPEEWYDENGVLHTLTTSICAKCGLTEVCEVYYIGASECIYYEYRSVQLYKDGITILQYSNCFIIESHDYNYTYEMHGDTCSDGYYIFKECNVCGKTEHEYYSWHQTERIEYNLYDYGFCGDRITLYQCTVCNQYTEWHKDDVCNWEFVETTPDGYDLHTCSRCNGSYLSFSGYVGETYENCEITHLDSLIYLMNGEEIFRFEKSYRTTLHNGSYVFELNGDSCENGFTATYICSDCGYSETETGNHHQHYLLFDLNSSHGCCNEHILYVEACPCGYYFNYFSTYEIQDEIFSSGSYTCDKCGLNAVYENVINENGCEYTEEVLFSVTVNGKNVYSYDNENTYYDHNFAKVETSYADGTTVFTVTCTDCGEVSVTEIFNVTTESNDGEYYYDLVFTPDESKTYAIVSYAESDTVVTLYQMIGNQLMYITEDDDGSLDSQFYLAYPLAAGATYVYRISFYDQTQSGDILISLSEINYGNCHCGDKETLYFTALLGDATNCEEGTVNGALCKDCGRVQHFYFRDSHSLATVETIDLSEYNACYGTIHYSVCACGQNSNVDFGGCAYNLTSNKYYDENGRLIHSEARTCDTCGLRYNLSYYTVKNTDNCTLTYYYTVIVQVGYELIFTAEYTSTGPDHDYEITTTLIAGEGSSCEDGVHCVFTCRDCGESYDVNHRDHEQYIKQVIDLSEYGSVCGGIAELIGCACGRYSNIRIADSYCDFDYQWCEFWIEDYVAYQNSWMYVCAVTDPECAFVIRCASYYVNDPGSCLSYLVETWQFGYDRNTGECLYEITFRCGEYSITHEYEVTDIENGVREECRLCGSFIENMYYYDDNQNLIKHVTNSYNALREESNEKYASYVYEYAFDPDGNKYTSLEYQKITYYDGEVFESTKKRVQESYTASFGENGRRIYESFSNSYGEFHENEYAYVYYKGYEYTIFEYSAYGEEWQKYDYSYSFDGICERTTVYSSRYEKNYTYTENCCRRDIYVTLETSTCSQKGSACLECAICNNRTDPFETSPFDHDWERCESGLYECTRCGLENANGASGSIIMEDLTERFGNGEYYVIGYYAQNDVKFTNYVAIVLPDGKEISVSVQFIEIDGVVAFAFSIADIEDFANANGYTDYDVRFTFVPYGDDGNFDYAITLT